MWLEVEVVPPVCGPRRWRVAQLTVRLPRAAPAAPGGPPWPAGCASAFVGCFGLKGVPGGQVLCAKSHSEPLPVAWGLPAGRD